MSSFVGGLVSQYLEVATLSLTIISSYLSAVNDDNANKAADKEQNIFCPPLVNAHISTRLLLTTFALAGLLTLIRQLFLYGSSTLFFGFILAPFSKLSSALTVAFNKLGFSIKDGGRVRFGEALYGLLSHSFCFSLASLIVNLSSFNGNLISNLDAFLDDDKLLNPTKAKLIDFLYWYECAHYISSIVVVFILKKPFNWYSSILAVHHIVALTLLALSYCFGIESGSNGQQLLHIGVAVVYLHHLCDILLGITKVLAQVKTEAGSLSSAVLKVVRVTNFIAFTGTWFVARLYAFPVMLIRSCARRMLAVDASCWPFEGILLYGFLMLIALMNVYWACVILGVAVRCTLKGGGAEAIEDVRDAKVMVVKKDGQKEEEVNGKKVK